MQHVLLRHEGDALLQHLKVRVQADVVQENLAAVSRRARAQGVHQGRFARTAGAQDANKLAWLYNQSHLVQNLDPLIAPGTRPHGSRKVIGHDTEVAFARGLYQAVARETKRERTDIDAVVKLQQAEAVDAHAVDEGAVAAAQIAKRHSAAGNHHLRMAARNARMIEHQGYLGAIPADDSVTIEQKFA